jgi:hypothetical protein
MTGGCDLGLPGCLSLHLPVPLAEGVTEDDPEESPGV